MHTAEVAGITLAYTEQGDGTPVVFIHGTGTYSATFDPVLERLDGRVRAITYDRRGFAASGGRPARGLGEHVGDVAALIELLGAAPATVLGSSAGGVLALRLAVERPDLVRSLVLIEPAWQIPLVPAPSATAAIARVNARWLIGRDAEGAAQHFYRWATSYARGGNQFDSYPETWKRTAVGHARTALRELTQVAVPTPRRSALRRIQAPTTVLIGDGGLRLFQRTAERVAAAVPGARTVAVPGAAHLVYTDDPATCADAILAAAA